MGGMNVQKGGSMTRMGASKADGSATANVTLISAGTNTDGVLIRFLSAHLRVQGTPGNVLRITVGPAQNLHAYVDASVQFRDIYVPPGNQVFIENMGSDTFDYMLSYDLL
jgi:hypothetical protein